MCCLIFFCDVIVISLALFFKRSLGARLTFSFSKGLPDFAQDEEKVSGSRWPDSLLGSGAWPGAEHRPGSNWAQGFLLSAGQEIRLGLHSFLRSALSAESSGAPQIVASSSGLQVRDPVSKLPASDPDRKSQGGRV